MCDTIIIYEFIELGAPTINECIWLFLFFFNVCATFTTTFRIFGKPFWGNSIFGKHIYDKQHTLKNIYWHWEAFRIYFVFLLMLFLRSFLLLVEMKLRKNWLKKHFWGESFVMKSCRTIVIRTIVGILIYFAITFDSSAVFLRKKVLKHF